MVTIGRDEGFALNDNGRDMAGTEALRDFLPGEECIPLSIFVGAQAAFGKVHNCHDTDWLAHQFKETA